MKIGVFDSGVGGFSVVGPLLRLFPDVSILYVADTAHVPYSNRSPEDLCGIVCRILRFLQEEKVDAVIFACNTSSALVLPQARPFAFVPFFGVVEPGIEGALAATKGKGIGVAANDVTARSGIFKKLIRGKNKGIPIIEQACGALVPFVEQGDLRSENVVDAVRQCCEAFQGKIDTLILGCTHFPFLKEIFSRILPDTILIDPAEFLVKAMTGLLGEQGKGHADHLLFATKHSPHVEEWARNILGWKAGLRFLNLDLLEPWQPGNSNAEGKSSFAAK